MNTVNYKKIMDELRTEYMESLPEKFQLWREYFVNENWQGLELEYHKMKGTGTTYGAPEVTELCALMEKICKTQQLIREPQLEGSIRLLESIKAKYLEDQDFDLQGHPDFIDIKSQDT